MSSSIAIESYPFPFNPVQHLRNFILTNKLRSLHGKFSTSYEIIILREIFRKRMGFFCIFSFPGKQFRYDEVWKISHVCMEKYCTLEL